MIGRALGAILVVVALAAATATPAAQALEPSTFTEASGCTDSTGTSSSGGGFTRGSARQCGVAPAPATGAGGTGSVESGTQSLSCGSALSPSGAPRTSANPFCAQVLADCAAGADAEYATTTSAVITRQPDGSWKLTAEGCLGEVQRVGRDAVVTGYDAYQQVVTRLPAPAVRAVPGKGVTLVNMQTIFWVDSAADRSLGTVTLLGHRVGLRVHATSVVWDFGDGVVESADDLGRPYTSGDHCGTPICPGFFGHVYQQTSSSQPNEVFAVSSRVSWSGEFSVDGGPWREVRGPGGTDEVAGPRATTTVKVVQARGVLVG